MAVVSMKALLEAGVHFGHRTRRWNPKMRPYIFTERSRIHIIDLQQTVLRLNEYYDMVRDTVAKGGTVLFVGTKRQAQATVQQEAERAGMPFINQRWLGGTLTNWVTIKQRLDYLLRMERRLDAGEFRGLSKKEQLTIQRELDKLNRRLGGLKTMRKLPDLVFVVDTNLEDLAVKEANKLHIPIIGMVDTNSDPDPIDYVIPSNDDAIRAVKLIVSIIANAAEEGMRIREVEMVDTGQVSRDELAEMEQYLGPSTLAKLQAADDEELDAYADYEDEGLVVDEEEEGDFEFGVLEIEDIDAEIEAVEELEAEIDAAIDAEVGALAEAAPDGAAAAAAAAVDEDEDK
jgi:small subunit ribosomal protein S2